MTHAPSAWEKGATQPAGRRASILLLWLCPVMPHDESCVPSLWASGRCYDQVTRKKRMELAILPAAREMRPGRGLRADPLSRTRSCPDMS